MRSQNWISKTAQVTASIDWFGRNVTRDVFVTYLFSIRHPKIKDMNNDNFFIIFVRNLSVISIFLLNVDAFMNQLHIS